MPSGLVNSKCVKFDARVICWLCSFHERNHVSERCGSQCGCFFTRRKYVLWKVLWKSCCNRSPNQGGNGVAKDFRHGCIYHWRFRRRRTWAQRAKLKQTSNWSLVLWELPMLSLPWHRSLAIDHSIHVGPTSRCPWATLKRDVAPWSATTPWHSGFDWCLA